MSAKRNRCISPFFVLVVLTTVLGSDSFTHDDAITHPSRNTYQSSMLKHPLPSENLRKRETLLNTSLSTQNSDNDGRKNVFRAGTKPVRDLANLAKMSYQSYSNALEKRPLMTKSITTGIIQGIGDVLSQLIESKNAGIIFATNFSLRRVVSFMVAGWFFVGPFVHHWYEFLWKIGKWQEQKYGTSKTKQTLTQVLVDQTIGVAMFFPLYFYIYELSEAIVGLRKPLWLTATKKIQKEMMQVLVTQYEVWPLFTYVNFAFVPQNLRVLFGDIVAVFWNAYLCMKVS